MLGILAHVRAPSHLRATRLSEQLSFLQARETFDSFSLLMNAKKEVSAAVLARCLFEDAMRWAWVDEAPEERTSAFIKEAQRAYRPIADAAVEQHIDAGMFFGPLVQAELLVENEDGPSFPRPFEHVMAWMPDTSMHYLQYRILSQYVHSSLLAAASTVVEDDGELRNTGQLPDPARLTAVRNAASSMVFIFEETREGLYWPGPSDLNVALFSVASRIAEITYRFAPASA